MFFINLQRQYKTPSKFAVPFSRKNGDTPLNRKRHFVDNFSTIKKPLRNTFSTPNKVSKVDDHRPNQTDQFLKPPEFSLEEFDDFALPSSKTSSTWNLNCSTSTDLAESTNIARRNDSPLIEMVCSKVNNIMEQRLQEFMTSFQQNVTAMGVNFDSRCGHHGDLTQDHRECESNNLNLFRKEMPLMIRKEIADLQTTAKSPIIRRFKDQSTSIDENVSKHLKK